MEEIPDKIPAIKFESIGIVKESKAMSYKDSALAITISFTNVDMDLGLNMDSEEDTAFSPLKINPATNETIVNPYFYNYLIKIFTDEGSGFTEFMIPDGQSMNGRFPRIGSSNLDAGPYEIEKTGKWSGKITIHYNFSPAFKSIIKGKRVIFKIQIVDRMKNISNEVTTAELRR